MSADNATMWALLTSFTNPDPRVQQNTLAQITTLSQQWEQMPYVLAEFLAHGNSAASAEEQAVGQQAAGTILKQILTERVAAVTLLASGGQPAVNYPQLNLSAFDVPLLFAICSGDKKIQVSASACLSQLVHYANEGAKLMAKNNADGAAAAGEWIQSLIGRLEQLVTAENVSNNHLGVSRCLGVLMEDRTQQLLSEARSAAVTGEDSEEHASAALVMRLEHMTRFIVPVYKLLAFLVTQSNAFPAKLNALSCVASISFVLGDPEVAGDDSDEDVSAASRKGAAAPPKDAKAARAQLANEMYKAEKHLVDAVASALPIIVAEAQQNCDVSNEAGLQQLLDSFNASLSALSSISAHWARVQSLAIAVLPTVLQWLAVFDWRQQAAKVAAIGPLVIDPVVLRACSFEAEALRIICLDFIAELAQQIEDSDVSDALIANHVAILQQLYAASVLDEMSVSEVCVDADRHVPDEAKDVLFPSKNKNGQQGGNNNNDDEDALLDDGNDDHDNNFRCTSPARTSAMFCFSTITLVLPPAFVFAVMDMLYPVVQKHLALNPTDKSSDWLELEGALSFLAEALTNAVTTGDDDDDENKNRMSAIAEQVAVICCRFMGVGQNADGSFGPVTAHYAGPVRAASARVLAKIGECIIYGSDPDAMLDATPQQLAEFATKTNKQNLILDTIVSVLQHTCVHDVNKAVLCASIGSLASILQTSLVAQADDAGEDFESDDEGPTSSGAVAGASADGDIPFVHVKPEHLANFYALSAQLVNMPLSQRVCFMKLLPDISKADVEVLKKTSPFLHSVEAVFMGIMSAWKQLVPSLDCYESLSLGDSVYELLQVLTNEEPFKQLPAVCARAIWQDIGVTVFQTAGFAQNLLNGIDHSGLTTETVSMATDLLSGICDAAEKSVMAELFNSTNIASVIASIVLPNLTRKIPADEDKSKTSALEELTRAALGLLGDFCGIVEPTQVHTVADTLVAPIAHVLMLEAAKMNQGSFTIAADGKSVSKKYKGGLTVTSIGGADLDDLYDDENNERVMLGNTLWCLAKLLETISSGEEFLRICPTALPTPDALQNFVGSCAVLLRLLGNNTNMVTKINLLIVTAKFGAMFPAVLDAAGGVIVILSEAKTLVSIEDMTELLDVSIFIAKYFSASAALQQRAAADIKARGLILSLALAIAPSIKKCMGAAAKGDTESVSAAAIAKAQEAHQAWVPMVTMCQDAANTAPSARHSTTMKVAEKKLMQQVYFS